MKRIAPLFLTVGLFAACSQTKQVAVEPAPAYQPAPQSTPIKLPTVLPPKLAEVQDAVKRIFKDAAVVDPNYKPNFLAGDFNGDGSQDIAVIVRPAPDKLDKMNEEFPAWLLRDPRATKRVLLGVEKDDVLLAVIHGYGANDWRDPEATQTFLLKNVVGSDLRVQTGKEFINAHSGKKLPRPQGDLIGETLQGTQGYIYFAAANYSWYDPNSFKEQPQQTRMVHQPRAVRAHAQAQPKAPVIEMITAGELKAKLASNQPVTIIDVRSSEGFAASSTTIKGSIHFKLRKLKSRLYFPPLKDLPKDREIVTYCACPKDESSIAAAQVFQAKGFTRVKVLQGGWHEWLRANGPVEPKTKG